MLLALPGDPGSDAPGGGEPSDGDGPRAPIHGRAAEQEAEHVQWRQLVEALPQIVWITRPDGYHVHFNQQWMDFTGLTLVESLGDGWNPPFHPDERPLARHLWAEATRTGEPYEIEYRLRRHDGAYRWMLGRAVPLRDERGEVVKWFGTCTDIEDLKAALDDATQLRNELERRATHDPLTGLANRDVYVGLQGGFGTLRLGNMDDLVKNIGRKVDFFHSTQIGESRSITAFNGMDRRIANGVRYDSPKLGPVTLNGHYGMSNVSDQDGFTDFTTWTAGAVVSMGGLYFGAAHSSQEAAGAVANTKETQRGTRVSASYSFGFGLTLAGLYQTFTNPNSPVEGPVN